MNENNTRDPGTVRLPKKQPDNVPDGGTFRIPKNETGSVPDGGTFRIPKKEVPQSAGMAEPGTMRLPQGAPQGQMAGGQPESGTFRLSSAPTSFDDFRQNQMLGKELSLNGSDFVITGIISEGKTGEADIYLVKNQQQEIYIFKKYKQDIQVKQEVLQTVKSIKHPHVIEVMDYGIYEQGFFELMEYAEGGTLTGKGAVRDVNEFKQIIKQTTDALYHCHQKGLVHRDIKPENLFLKKKSGIDVLIADFGIASMVDVELERAVTSRNLTFQYAAPETLTFTVDNSVIIGPPVDYFALGLSLLTIWHGRDWFENKPFGIIPSIIVQGDIDIPEDMPHELRDPVQGFLAHHPADRWTFEEVQRWLAGEKVPVARVTFDEAGALEPFDFIKIGSEVKTAYSAKDMAHLMFTHKDQGIKHLYRGDIADWIKQADRLISSGLKDITEEHPKGSGNETYGLLKGIYTLDPEHGFIDKNWQEHSVHQGGGIEDVLDKVGDLLEDQTLSQADEELQIAQYMEGNYISVFLEANNQQAVKELISSYVQQYEENSISRKKAFIKMILLLQKGHTFRCRGKDYNSFQELKNAPAETHKYLSEEVHKSDSKFLCWLEEMALKRDSKDISDSEISDLLALIEEMPWLKKYDANLRARLNRRDESGYTDLMNVSKAGDLNSCKNLVDHGADIHFRSKEGVTAFSIAAIYERLDIMEYLKEKKADINPLNHEDNPLIHELAQDGHEKSVAFLLQNGIPADTLRESDSWTPLMVAVNMGYAGIASILLNAGSDPNIMSNQELAPLHYAVGDNNITMVEMLLKHKADVNIGLKEGFAPLHLAARDGCMEAARLLLENKAQPNGMDEFNQPPLHYAVMNSTPEMVALLLNSGADPNRGVNHLKEVDYEGKQEPFAPALAFAVWNNKYESAKLLLEKGAEADVSFNNHSLVQHTVNNNRPKMAELLLSHGADPNTGVDNIQEGAYPKEEEPLCPPLAYAVWEDKDELVKILLAHGAAAGASYHSNPLLNFAVKKDKTDVVLMLLNHGADPCKGNDANETPLHAAMFSKKNNLVIIEELLKRGANPYINDTGSEPYINPFCIAAGQSTPEVIKLFLKYGAKPEKAVDNHTWKQNPFFWAVQQDNLKNLKLLADNKNGINFLDSDNYTPLMLAAYTGKREAVDILMNAGAKLNIESKYGNNVVEIAKKEGHQDLAAYIFKKGKFSSGARVPAVLIKLLASLLGIYTLLWAVKSDFFLFDGFSLYYGLAAAFISGNLCYWYLYGLPLGILRKKEKPWWLVGIRMGIIGIVLWGLLQFNTVLPRIPYIESYVAGITAPSIPWLEKILIHPLAETEFASLITGIPVLQILKANLTLLILHIFLLAGLLLLARKFDAKYNRFKKTAQAGRKG